VASATAAPWIAKAHIYRTRPVGDKSTDFGNFRPLKDGRQAQCRHTLHNELMIGKEHR